MKQYKLGAMEQKFADLIWVNEPISSRTLTQLCEEAFDWKKVLLILCSSVYVSVKYLKIKVVLLFP